MMCSPWSGCASMYLVYPENHPVEGIAIGVKSAFFSELSRIACMGILRSSNSVTRFSGTVAPHCTGFTQYPFVRFRTSSERVVDSCHICLSIVYYTYLL